MLKILARPEVLIYIAALFFAGAFLVLNVYTESEDGSALVDHYFDSIADRILWLSVFLCVVFMIRLTVFFVIAMIKSVVLGVHLYRPSFNHFFRASLTFLRNVLIVGIPFVLALYALTLALGELNIFNTSRLRDELVLQWDVFLTHTFPSLSLASFQYPGWFVEAVRYSFQNVVAALALLGAYLFQAKQKLFREAGGAYFLGVMIMFIGWIFLPVLSPHDRFIDNVYDLEISSQAQEYVDNYHPQEEIALFLENMRESKEGLSVMPTTAIPSAHVAWAVLLVYYAYRTRRLLAVAVLPLAILSTFGTVLFAQHYFIDLPTGIATGVLSIAVARYIAKRQEVYEIG